MITMELTAAEAWSRILERARSQLPESVYRMWLEHTEAVALSEGRLAVAAVNDFVVQWIEDKYAALLEAVAEELFGRRLAIEFQVQEGAGPVPRVGAGRASGAGPVVERPRAPARPGVVGTPLNERYTFDRFVVGPNNQLAAAASRAVSEAPARIYNPLFIYGGVGLGKTHLMHAIGHAVLARDPEKRVAYVSSERFTNELIASIQEGRMPEFRRRYRETDVLLIDDVHFLGEKERTQEEFFHTFNTLHEASRQIIITSDRPPKEIPTLEDRLRSRFEWGLIADIQPPDLETRIAILKKKAETDGIVVPDDVAEFIAQRINTNIRELEGALVRVVAYASLTRSSITVELATDVLRDLLPPARARTVTIATIQQVVAEFFGIRPEEMRAKRRTKGIAFPRQVAMYLARELTDASLPHIGQEFGGRDHTTVMHACQRVREVLQKDVHLAASLKRLVEMLQRRST